MNCYLLLFQVDEHNQQYDAENSKSKDENGVHEESFLIGHDLWHDDIRLRFMGGFIPFSGVLKGLSGRGSPVAICTGLGSGSSNRRRR